MTSVWLSVGEQDFELLLSRSPQETVADTIATANRFLSLPACGKQQEFQVQSKKDKVKCLHQCA